SVDAEDLRLRQRVLREEAVDALADLRQQHLHRLQPALLVLAAVGLEPVPVLVAGQRLEEAGLTVGEPLEAGLGGGESLRHARRVRRTGTGRKSFGGSMHGWGGLVRG